MHFLRSTFFIAVVSALVLTGYAHGVLDFCCVGEKREQVAQSTTSSDESAPAKDDCQCLCHQIFHAHAAPLFCVVPGVLAPADFVVHGDEFPPDAVPVGIDHPPQLA